MADEIQERVVQFLAQEFAVRPARLAPETRLFHDLGCDGDDAAELLERFTAAFGARCDGFVFDWHFGPEAALNPFLYLYWRLWKPAELRKVPLTVADLVEAAQTGRLQSPARAAV
jgi:hypothetical protein